MLMGNLVQEDGFYFSDGNHESEEFKEFSDEIIGCMDDFIWKDRKPFEIIFRAEMEMTDKFFLSRNHIGNDVLGRMQPSHLNFEERVKINSEIIRIR